MDQILHQFDGLLVFRRGSVRFLEFATIHSRFPVVCFRVPLPPPKKENGAVFRARLGEPRCRVPCPGG